MGHYLLHAASKPWLEQLFFAGVVVVVFLLVFVFIWWRKRAAVPAHGDFAAVVEAPDVAVAMAAQQSSSLSDAADAWQQTKNNMNAAKGVVHRAIWLVFAGLSALLFTLSFLAVLMQFRTFPALNWVQFGFYLVLCSGSAWATRAMWHACRGEA